MTGQQKLWSDYMYMFKPESDPEQEAASEESGDENKPGC